MNKDSLKIDIGELENTVQNYRHFFDKELLKK